MNVTPDSVRAILAELIDENPFACRALLKIVSVTLSDEVPTAAVTCENQPRLLLNPVFLASHCHTESEVKAVICHEFLHVLLRHTDNRVPVDHAGHIALDAVINAIIHRTLGEEYSAMMSRYYGGDAGVQCLLRPPEWGELSPDASPLAVVRQCRGFARAWTGLYAGRLVSDDIGALADDLLRWQEPDGSRQLLGDHAARARSNGRPEPLPESVRTALERAIASLNGEGIWRSPRDHGVGVQAYAGRFDAADGAIAAWRAEALRVLRRHLQPDRDGAARGWEPRDCLLPVLGPRDRRAFARALWSPVLPQAQWEVEHRSSRASAQVYLDVSGSMHHEMPHIVALLAQLGRYIRRPFWAFSDVVAPAVIRAGQLQADTTGGTSMRCVLEHVVRTRPRAAVVVTDGYIEAVDTALLREASGTRLHALVTRNGCPTALARARIPYTQLARLPA